MCILTKVIFVFAFLVVQLPSQLFAQTYGWMDISENVPLVDSLYVLTDVQFVNDNEGWITTYLNQNDTSNILHTTDGGEIFELSLKQLKTRGDKNEH